MSYLKSLSFGEYYLGLFVLDSCHINTSDQVCLDNTLDLPSIPVFQWDFSIQMSRLQSDQLGRLHSLHSDQLGSPHPDQLGNLGAANVEAWGIQNPVLFFLTPSYVTALKHLRLPAREGDFVVRGWYQKVPGVFSHGPRTFKISSL